MRHKDLINAVLSQGAAPSETIDIECLNGGRQHLSWRVRCETGQFVIKQLATSSFLGSRDMAHYETTELFAAHLAHHFPFVMRAIEPLQGQLVHEVNGEYFVLYPHFDGVTLNHPPSAQQCAQMGKSLALIHGSTLRHRFAQLGQYDLEQEIDLSLYLDDLKRDQSQKWLDAADKFSLLDTCYEHFCNKTPLSGDEMLVSHRDINVQNVLWNSQDFVIIDWESAGLIHPAVELLGLALNFAGIEQGSIDWTLFHEVVKAYQKQRPLPSLNANIIAHYYTTWFAWLSYLLNTQIEHNLTQKEINDQIKITINAIVCTHLYRDRILDTVN